VNFHQRPNNLVCFVFVKKVLLGVWQNSLCFIHFVKEATNARNINTHK
jgi:hypothetical protein